MTVSPSTERFDRIARLLAQRLARRRALQAGAAGAAGLALAPAILHAQKAPAAVSPAASPAATDDGASAFLFVQSAAGGSFVQTPAATPAAGSGAPTYTLTLDGHTGGTIFFSDRPARIFGQAPTDRFIAGLGFSPSNPPNAAIVTHGEDGTDDVLIVELLNPAYDPDSGALSYDATVLGSYVDDGLAFQAATQQDDALPATLGATTLFIDDCPDLSDCIVTGGPVYSAKVIGPIPGGPYGQCWHWKDFDCKPCDGHDDGYFADLCNQSYSECNNECGAG